MGFPRKEYWSGLPFPSLGDLPDPGTDPMSPEYPALAGKFFISVPPGKPRTVVCHPPKISWFYTVNFSSQYDTLLCQQDCVCVYFPLHNCEQYIKLGGHNLLNIAFINHFISLFIAL